MFKIDCKTDINFIYTYLISTIYLQKFDVIVPYQTFQQCKILREWGMSKIKRHFNVKIRYVNMYTQ